MIILTKLNSTEFALNPDLIETIVSNPDTTIRLTTKNYQIVMETKEEVIEKIIRFRIKCNDRSYRLTNEEQRGAE